MRRTATVTVFVATLVAATVFLTSSLTVASAVSATLLVGALFDIDFLFAADAFALLAVAGRPF